MKKKDPLIHFPFYCNQYLGMLAKYTYEEQGAFIRVVATCIAEDNQIECCSINSKYRLFSAFNSQEQKALDNVFDEAISVASKIMKTQKAIREKKREAGRQGGRPPATKPGINNNLMDNQMDCQINNLMDNH